MSLIEIYLTKFLGDTLDVVWQEADIITNEIR